MDINHFITLCNKGYNIFIMWRRYPTSTRRTIEVELERATKESELSWISFFQMQRAQDSALLEAIKNT